MDAVARIIKARSAGVVRCAVLDGSSDSLAELTAAAGLQPAPERLREVDESYAQGIVTQVLRRDLAYGTELMSDAEAQALAAGFLELFRDRAPRYFTNGDFHRWPGKRPSSPSWNPMTDATFDTGVLVLARGRTGYLWVEDED